MGVPLPKRNTNKAMGDKNNDSSGLKERSAHDTEPSPTPNSNTHKHTCWGWRADMRQEV